MSKTRLNSVNIKEYANKIARIMHHSDKPVPKDELVKELDLTTGQVSTIIKYMRRCSEEDFIKYIRWYPISSKRGYSFMEKAEDFLPCYMTLYEWSESILRTIDPMRKYLESHGVDIASELIERRREYSADNYLIDIPDMAEEAWHYE